MGFKIDSSCLVDAQEFERRQAETRQAYEKYLEAERKTQAMLAREEPYLAAQREEAAARAARGEQKFSDNFIPQASGGDNGSNITPPSQDSPNYYRDLWGLTAPAANLHGHQAHPELSGASAGNIHSSSELRDRNWAAEQNAAQQLDTIPTYNESSPVIVYRTDMLTVETVRAYNPSPSDKPGEPKAAIVGRWFTDKEDVTSQDGTFKSRQDIQDDLGLRHEPNRVASVDLDVGTKIEASRPISGEARQYKILETPVKRNWFSCLGRLTK